MQDFAPFIPELLGAFRGPQTPGRKGRRACLARRMAAPSASICLLLFNFLLLLQNLLTSLTRLRFTYDYLSFFRMMLKKRDTLL